MFGWKSKATAAPQRMAETSGAFDGAAIFAGHGLITGTKVASNLGWRAVDTIAPGDQVLTFDHGMQYVVEVRRTVMFTDATTVPEHMLPVTVPAGALGNRNTMRLLPEQGVMVESDAAIDAFGDPFAVVPATSLIGFRGVHRDLQANEFEIVTLFFAKPEVIYAEGGALIYCPQAHLQLADMLDPSSQPYDVLNIEEASWLIDCMEMENMPAPHMQTQAA
ncbi:MAG: Hint domain-containing protein [Aliishimia sp.]